MLAGGKNSRLYKRLVYDMQIAQDVRASQGSAELVSEFCITATARSGHVRRSLDSGGGWSLTTLAGAPPLHGLAWLPTRQPVVTDLWHTGAPPSDVGRNLSGPPILPLIERVSAAIEPAGRKPRRRQE